MRSPPPDLSALSPTELCDLVIALVTRVTELERTVTAQRDEIARLKLVFHRHTERHLIGRIGWLRAAVLGANDGIISTASLIVGVPAAATSVSAALTAAASALPCESAPMDPAPGKPSRPKQSQETAAP